MPEPTPAASEVEFITALTPCLQLCAPVGMSEQDRQTWFDAAYLALRHLPACELYASAREAMKTVDHPSKIVPAIIRAAEGDRKDRYQPLTNPITPPSHRLEQKPDPAERAKVAQTMGQLLKRMQANTPTLDTVLGKQVT